MDVESLVTGAGACPLCGCERFGPFRFGLLCCARCALVVDRRIFVPELDRNINMEFFGEGYEPYSSVWVRWFFGWKNRRYLSNLRRVSVRGGRLLEVGVGDGSFLAAARAGGFEVEGCDLSAPLAERAAARAGVPVHCVALDELPAAAYDVVCMHHVLEHVRDPVTLLRQAAARLRPGGTLHLAVPNIDCWEAHIHGWTYYDFCHLSYFDQQTLRLALESAGFRVEKMLTHETFSGWFLALLRTLLGMRPAGSEIASSTHAPGQRRRNPAVEHAYRMTMVLAGMLTWPLRALQGRLGRGDELLAIARVP